MPSQARQLTRGFTLVELMIVLAAAGILLATSFTVISNAVPRMRLRHAAREVAGAVRDARLQAIRTNGDLIMPFDTSGGRYVTVSRTASGAVGRSSVDGVMRSVASLPADIRFVRPDGGSPTVTLVPPSDESLKAAKFNRKGQLESTNVPGYVYLGDAGRGNYMRLSVMINGNVKFQTWRDGSWH